jgi:phasin family protein
MINTPEQMMQIHRDALQMMQTAAIASINGLEKLASLQMQAARTSLEENAEMAKHLLAAKDVKSLSDLTSTALQPAAEKYASYAKHCYEIMNETTSELTKLVEKQMAEGNKQLYAALDTMARNAPAGSEGVVTLVKSAVSAANTAYDQVSRATKQVVEMAEANIAAAGKANGRPAAAASRKAA